MCIFEQNNNGNNRTQRCNKARFLYNTLKKTASSRKSLIGIYSILGVVTNLSLSGSGRKVWWAGHLLTFSAFRMGAYSRLGAYSNKYGTLIILCSGRLVRKITLLS